MMVPFFYVLKLCGLLRINAEEEEVRPFSPESASAQTSTSHAHSGNMPKT